MRAAPLVLALLGLPSLAAAQGVEQDSGATEVTPRPGQVPRGEDYETARMVGTGLGMRAGAFGTSAVLSNPANLMLTQQYHVEAIASYVPSEGSFAFGSVIADSSTGRVHAGVATRAIFGDGARGYRGSDNRLSLGMAAGDRIGLGLSLRYLRLKSRDDTSDGYPAAPELRAITLDASLRVTPVDGLHVAAYGYNLVRTGSLLAPTRLGGGVVYQYETKLQLGFDFLADLRTFRSTTYQLGGGLEWWAGDKYPLRLGYSYDTGRNLHAMSLGLGYVEQRYGVELSLRQEFGQDRQSVLLFSARYAMDPQTQQR